MKAELTEITEEMVGNNKELAEALMNNFNALNETAESRENLILGRLNKIQKDIVGIRQEIGSLKTLDKKIDKIMKHFNIDDKDLLKG